MYAIRSYYGMKREREIFDACVASEESASLRHVFFAERAAAKIPGISKDIELKPP